MKYYDFLSQKSVLPRPHGFPCGELPEKLFDWQKAVTKFSVGIGRAGNFEDCGLGKTPQQIAWADQVSKHTGAPTLILAPLAVAPQTSREGQKFGIRVNIAETSADIRPGVNVTNYEKLNKFDASVFSGVVLDESSILKAYTGKVKREIVKKFSETPYRLSCSATPAPNDLMELLNQAEFLGIMRSSEALSCWFIADQSNSGHYRLKGHAEKDFWRWVASWAVCISKPSDIGYSDDGYDLPKLDEMDVVVRSDEKVGDILSVREKPDMSATGFHKEKRKTLQQRVEKCVEIVNSTNEQYVIWCYQNDEADALKKLLPEAIEIRGSDSAKAKENATIGFVNGNFRVLISKPSIFGYGLNFQNCRNAVFCGLDYSYESYYQAVRRFYRFGQPLPVNVWRVIGENEKQILETINRKAQMKSDMGRSMADAMKDIQIENLHGREFKLDLQRQHASIPEWLRSEAS